MMMRLESIEYILELEDTVLDSERVAKIISDLQPLMFKDFSTRNRKLAKFLLYFKYPHFTDVIGENPNSRDLNVFTIADVVSKIVSEGYTEFLDGRRQNGNN